jgi:hypothetical protein
VIVLGLLAVAALGGCTTGKTAAPAPQASVKPSPTGLAAGVGGLSSYRFRVVAKAGTYTGRINPVADLLEASVTVWSGVASLKIDTLRVREAAYTRLTGPAQAGFESGAWYRLDLARVTRPGALGLSAIEDPTGVQALVAATRDVRREGRTYRGTVDMTRVAAWGPVTVGQVAQLGEAARAIPFEATVDEQERVTGVKVSIPNDPVEATYSDFGAAMTIEEPKNAEPLPDYLYGMLGL